MLRLGFRIFLLTLCSAFTAAWSSYGPTARLVGKTQAEVMAIMGPPTQQKTTAEGTRLVYARGPYGLHTYMIDVDRSGLVTDWRQVLKEKNFEKVTPGMPGSAVEAIIGPSFERVLLGRNRGVVWSYRFENSLCVWFQVELDNQLVVRSAGYGIPPECARDDDWDS